MNEKEKLSFLEEQILEREQRRFYYAIEKALQAANEVLDEYLGKAEEREIIAIAKEIRDTGGMLSAQMTSRRHPHRELNRKPFLDIAFPRREHFPPELNAVLQRRGVRLLLQEKEDK